jgi:hypothetical protein
MKNIIDDINLTSQPDDVIAYKNNIAYFYCPFCHKLHSMAAFLCPKHSNVFIGSNKQIITVNDKPINAQYYFQAYSQYELEEYIIFAIDNQFLTKPTIAISINLHYKNDLCHLFMTNGTLSIIRNSVINGKIYKEFQEDLPLLRTPFVPMIPIKDWGKYLPVIQNILKSQK